MSKDKISVVNWSSTAETQMKYVSGTKQYILRKASAIKSFWQGLWNRQNLKRRIEKYSLGRRVLSYRLILRWFTEPIADKVQPVQPKPQLPQEQAPSQQQIQKLQKDQDEQARIKAERNRELDQAIKKYKEKQLLKNPQLKQDQIEAFATRYFYFGVGEPFHQEIRVSSHRPKSTYKQPEPAPPIDRDLILYQAGYGIKKPAPPPPNLPSAPATSEAQPKKKGSKPNKKVKTSRRVRVPYPKVGRRNKQIKKDQNQETGDIEEEAEQPVQAGQQKNQAENQQDEDAEIWKLLERLAPHQTIDLQEFQERPSYQRPQMGLKSQASSQAAIDVTFGKFLPIDEEKEPAKAIHRETTLNWLAQQENNTEAVNSGPMLVQRPIYHTEPDPLEQPHNTNRNQAKQIDPLINLLADELTISKRPTEQPVTTSFDYKSSALFGGLLSKVNFASSAPHQSVAWNLGKKQRKDTRAAVCRKVVEEEKKEEGVAKSQDRYA